MPPAALDRRYTLLVAARGRTDALARLQRFLSRQEAGFAVLVLDGSEPDLDRYARGVESVGTEFCSLCVDADLLFVEAIRRLVEFLAVRPHYAAAQGSHFNFSVDGEFEILSVPRWRAALDAEEPLDRLRQLFRNYEPLSCAVHRTEMLKAALDGAKEMAHPMFRDMLGAAIPAALGKVARLPVLHYASTPDSWHGWDAAEFVVGSTEGLLTGYRAYRESLIRGGKLAPTPGDPSAAWRLLDLIHLRFICERYRPAVVEAAIQARHKGLDPRQALLTLQPRKPRSSPLSLRAPTCSGRSRTYRFPRELEGALAELSLGGGASGLARSLAGYE